MRRSLAPSLLICAITLLRATASASSELPSSPQDPRLTQSTYWQQALQSPHLVDYPIVFIHGIGGGFDNWAPTLEILAPHTVCTIRYDEDGQLTSHLPDSPHTDLRIWNASYYHDRPVKEAFTGDLSTYAERLKVIITHIRKTSQSDKVILVGHSMGGLVARAYMSLDQDSWNSVHTIVTVATPHEGVDSSLPIVGQLRDLKHDSSFLTQLNRHWLQQIHQGYHNWAVIGALDIEAHETPDPTDAAHMTDSGGWGFIHLDSAIPFGEWRDALSQGFNQVTYDTPHFGYRVLIRGDHDLILTHAPIYHAIHWALQPKD